MSIQEEISEYCTCGECGRSLIGNLVYELDGDGIPLCPKCYDKFVAEAVIDNLGTEEIAKVWIKASSEALPSVTVYSDDGALVKHFSGR